MLRCVATVADIGCDVLTNKQIGPHSRWRHFSTPRQPDLLAPVLTEWKHSGLDAMEIARRLIDLFVVSVLVDGELRHSQSSPSALD